MAQTAFDLLVAALALAGGLWVLRYHGFRALLVLRPSRLRIEADAPAGQVPLPRPLEPLSAALSGLGFVPLGTHLEQPPLGPSRLCFDFAHPTHPAFATLFLSGGQRPRLELLSSQGQQAFFITANYRRPARSTPGRYVSGGLEGCTPERLFRAHLKRIERAGADPALGLEERVALGQAWLSGPGRLEVRQQNVLGLLWSLGSLGMVAVVWFDRFGR